MDIKRGVPICSESYVAAVATLLICFLASSSHAQQACSPSGQQLVEAAIEECVQMLREEPAGSSHKEGVHPAEDALGVNGGFYVPVQNPTDYVEYNVGDARFAATFTKCIRKANPDYVGSETSSVDLPVVGGERKAPARYQYTNKYQHHQLRDTQRKVVYTLIRIPEGGIESMGTWVSDKPGSYESSSGCKNSYGEPCGTKYFLNRAGGYEAL
ncbi:hypothetical protein [Luteibacter sp. OK325]|uniref:hypothetical protein n=1 Tax=Luteibacter sp. OK325 TaxID=2135670 RepID=UPI000D3B7313|nr:hypothetical protein [Luteibacter sp. OK325]